MIKIIATKLGFDHIEVRMSLTPNIKKAQVQKNFILNLIQDLRYPVELERLFVGVQKTDDFPKLLKNKVYFVKNKIDSCSKSFKNIDFDQLVRKHYISEEPGMISIKKSFTLLGSFQGSGITIDGPVSFEKDVTIGRSVITGPAFISEKSKIFDSTLRGNREGGLYVGKNCNIWGFSDINRSIVGNSSNIHTCNINDSIIGPSSNFGATQTTSFSGRSKNDDPAYKDKTMIGKRIVIANYSDGNKIKILDPSTNKVFQIDSLHFGTLSGTGVSCTSGTIIYPGTILGAGARILSTIPITGYIQPDQTCSLFVVIKKNKNGKEELQMKGTLPQLIKTNGD